jgi:O-antigen/teichoic acid export membrane protein
LAKNRITKILDTFRNSPQSLKVKVIKAGGWMYSLNVFQFTMQMLGLLICARLLDPVDFGVFNLSNVVFGSVLAFTAPGIIQAQIQKDELTNEDLHTSFWLMSARGFFLAGVITASAPWIANFFSEPRMTSVLRILSIGYIIRGFRNTGMVWYQRRLNYDKVFWVQSSGVFVSFITKLVLLCFFRDYWVLVGGLMAEQIASTIATYIVHPFRPHLIFKFENACELLRYGRWLMLSQIAGFASKKVPQIVIGRFLSMTEVGYFSFGQNTAERFGSLVVIMRQVMFPAYSKIKNETKKLRSGYLSAFFIMTLALVPITVALIMTSAQLIPAVFGEKWIPAIIIFNLFLVKFVLQVTFSHSSIIFKAIGKPYISTLAVFIFALSISGSSFLLVPYFGALGAAYGASLSAMVFLPFWLYMLNNVLHIQFSQIMERLLPILWLCILIWAGIFLTQHIVGISVYSTIIALFVGLITSVLYLFLFGKRLLGFLGWQQT